MYTAAQLSEDALRLVLSLVHSFGILVSPDMTGSGNKACELQRTQDVLTRVTPNSSLPADDNEQGNKYARRRHRDVM